MSIAFWKTVHLLGVVLFLGNIVVTALWKTWADRTRDPGVIAFAQRLVTITDIAFTAVGAVLLYVGGVMMVVKLGLPWSAAWLSWGQALFIVSGLVWLFILVPVQWRQSCMARQFAVTKQIPPGYWTLTKVWAGAGLVATLLPLVVLVLMVWQPA